MQSRLRIKNTFPSLPHSTVCLYDQVLAAEEWVELTTVLSSSTDHGDRCALHSSLPSHCRTKLTAVT